MNNTQKRETETDLQAWLKSQMCIDILQRTIAPIVRSKAINQGINLDSIGMDDNVNGLANCLWEFLCDKQERFSDLNMLSLNNNQSLLVSIIVNRFLSYCVDERRSSSPFHAYYQHMRKILSKAEGVLYLPETSGSFYAWPQDRSLKTLPKGVLSVATFGDWPQPGIAAKDIHDKPQMIALSRFFWAEATEFFKSECLVSIRDLAMYVAAVYGFEKTEPIKTSCDDEDGTNPLEEIADLSAYSRPDKSIIEGQLEKRARMLVSFWGAKERSLFLLRFAETLSLEETARQTGYKSAAAVDYQIKKLAANVRDNWDQWLFGYASEDGDTDVEQDYFFERLVFFCNSLH